MSRFAIPSRLVAVVTLVMVFSVGTALAPSAAGQSAHSAKTLRYDVALNRQMFFFEPDEFGLPAMGTPFLIRGYIYPRGTFAENGTSSGILADGMPEFPDDVVGTLYSRGWFLQDYVTATTGTLGATTQIFDLALDTPGQRTIITEGIELADGGIPFSRAITGGTGRYSKARGTATQTFVGINASGAPNVSFKLKVVK